MNLVDLYDAIEAHEDLRGVGVDMDKKLLAVEHIPTKMLTTVPAGATEGVEWNILEDIFTGKREPAVLQHMTRVVGYYSRIANWNKSKVGELKDRQKGDYAIGG